MSSNGELTNAPLRLNIGFNWAFLIELGVCGVLTIFFLFYFNRVFAAVISYALRAWTWHKYRVHIEFQALQFSLLGGRVFLKGVRYHGNNETIFIQTGYITWCYWLRNVRQLDVNRDLKTRSAPSATDSEKVNTSDGGKQNGRGSEEGASAALRPLPCRLQVNLSGVEWFVYNRSAAYDAVVAGLTSQVDEVPNSIPDLDTEKVDATSRGRSRAGTSREGSGRISEDLISPSKHASSEAEEEKSAFLGWDGKLANSSPVRSDTDDSSSGRRSKAEDHFALRFLPIHIEIEKAAVVLGNHHTKSVLITKFESASGEIDASDSSDLDQYRQLINFQFEHPVIQIKPNDDYKEDQTAAASRIKRGEGDLQDAPKEKQHTRSFLHRQRRKVWHKLQDLVPAFRSSVESISSSSGGTHTQPGVRTGSNSWQGLSRYLDEGEQDDKSRWSSIEYATVSTIVDSPEASMSFYWDVVGTVQSPRYTKESNVVQNINGDTSPEWGINLSLHGATINYGPWADRQRVDIQRVFFPNLCKDAVPSKPLVTGQFRVPTEFKLCIEFDEETTLRVPIKEESKNWKWTKQDDTLGTRPGNAKRQGKNTRKRKADKGTAGPEIRPFGWLDVNVGANAAVRYEMDMVPGHSGFANKLALDIPNLEVTTSVNHGLLWRSVENSLSCDLSNPLSWNGSRTWNFDILSKSLELFILREHVFLLIDLVDDWASGPPPEYLTFTPLEYLVNLHLDDFRLYLNVNDSNIINNPSDFDDNTFVSVFGQVLDAEVSIPLLNYRPHRNDISFHVDAKHGGLDLHVPPWNTQTTFLSSTELATLKELAIVGKYQYCSTTSTSNTDTLILDIYGDSAVAWFYGFVIRYYLKIKDNYFGDDIRFKTLEEYQEILRLRKDDPETDLVPHPPHKKSNDLDVILSVSADNSTVILPSNLYSATEHIRIEIASLSADLRFTNYYMDLDVGLSNLAFSQASGSDGASTPGSSTCGTQLFIDGLSVSGNRLFGLPPTEPTYVCNWDFSVGAVTGECTSEFLVRLLGGIKAIAFSFDDHENALPSITGEDLHDVTFLRASITSLRLWLHVDDTAFLLASGTITLGFNDWANSHFSKKVNLLLPDLKIACVDAESALRHRSRNQYPVDTHAVIKTTISVAIIQRKLGFIKDRQLQQEHIKRHDQRTHRAEFLLHNHLLDNYMLVPVDPPAMTVPPIPVPEVKEPRFLDGSIKSSRRGGSRHLHRKSSFLSIASSSSKSDASVLHRHAVLPSIETSVPNTRSRSLAGAIGPGRRIPLRDMSTSTGRQSSFYSAVGDTRGPHASTVTFSSSYAAPYFPLEEVEPEMRHMPQAPLREHFPEPEAEVSLDDIPSDRVPEDSSHTSIMVNFTDGLGAVIRPTAAQAVVNLVTALQAFEPMDILDELQIDTMGEISKMDKQKLLTGAITDLALQSPDIHIRILNSFSDVMSNQAEDQYDIVVGKVRTTTRSETTAVDDRKLETSTASFVTHLSLGNISITANERYSELNDPEAAVRVVLRDIVAWTVSGKGTQANLAFQAIELSTAGSKFEYLASLLNRTQSLVSEMSDAFTTRLERQCNRLRLFTYLVATSGRKTADPLFLTRTSNVLRSATDHLRTSDSWKIVSRLRQILTNLDDFTREGIASQCLDDTEHAPENAREQVVAALDQWRSWDLNSVDNCVLIKIVYGRPKTDEVPASSEHPLMLAVRVMAIRLIIDPGPKQNEIAMSKLTLLLENKTAASVEEVGPATKVQMVQTTIVQAFLADASINLNWELCELAERLLRLAQEGQSERKTQKAAIIAPPAKNVPAVVHDIHMVVAIEEASITFDTINIRAASISNGLKVSFATSSSVQGDGEKTASVILAADAASSRITSHLQELSALQLRFPSIYTSYRSEPGPEGSSTDLRLAGNCQELKFELKQELLVLMEVADLVIGDEVMHIHRLTQGMATRQSNKPEPDSRSADYQAASRTRVHVALFLDMYEIAIPLLRSLKYRISGVVARASVGAQLDNEVIFDFDIKENSHNLLGISETKSTSVALLQIPPTNGRISYSSAEDEHVLSVFASVEPVTLDAAAIHGLLTAINRPEISNVIAEVQEESAIIQAHLEEVFDSKKAAIKAPVSASKPFVYDASLTLAGFDIFANAQSASKNQKSARLDLNLGTIQVVVANRLNHSGPVLEYPELRMNLRHVMFELSRWNDDEIEPCGNLTFMAAFTATSKLNDSGHQVRLFHVKSDGLEINLFADTPSTVVEVLGYLQNKIKDIDLSREKNYLRKLRTSQPRIAIHDDEDSPDESISASGNMFEAMYSLELLNIQVSWLVGTYEVRPSSAVDTENLVLSLERIDLSTRKQNSARLMIENFQVQMVPATWENKTQRSANSALLPEVIFNVGYVSAADTRRLAFQAAGKVLDLQLTSQFMIPGSELQKSIASATEKFRAASASWTTPAVGPSVDSSRRQPFFGTKRMESLLVDAEFAGAVVYLNGKKSSNKSSSVHRNSITPLPGKYGQFSQTESPPYNTVLQAPGLAWKIEYKDNGLDDPSLNAEVKVDASDNTLYPSIVPLVLEISSTIKEIVSHDDEKGEAELSKPIPQKFMVADDSNILTTDPSAVLGRTRLNLGLRIRQQKFTLSCQPVARVHASALFEDIYLTVNTVRSTEHGHFFAASAVITKFSASVQHLYSRETTASFDVDSVFLSLMNSKHVSGTSGISAILKISPMKVQVNAKQLHDFLLFREIWIPLEIRQTSLRPAPASENLESSTFLVQRYQQVAATGAFPWNATVSVAALDVQLDLGQAIGKTAFIISNFWISSKKNSDWEQNLCLGFDEIGVDSTGRMSGLISLQNFKLRTTIQWPAREMALNQTPLVQASLGFSQLQIKAAFDYQAFLVADITSFQFVMYNVRNSSAARGDRLVAILDGEAVQVFCTTMTASQALALYQAFQRLIQEKRTNYEASIAELGKFMKRKTSTGAAIPSPRKSTLDTVHEKPVESPISLHTDVIVTLKAVNVGAYPNTFADHQIFKLEALNAQARFATTMDYAKTTLESDHDKIHSILGLTLGQLRIGLAGVKEVDMPKSVNDISVEAVVKSATGSRGGTILKVPKVEATMQTWQVPFTTDIEYIFKSAFEGKVEVGWNYSRIGYIRNMWASHSKALAQRLGKPLPPSAVRITGVPGDQEERKEGEQQKITAEVNMPQSKYSYNAIEEPIIETPQLRDMGEATPPLEWMGLHRDKFPNLVHQIVIVTLLELASEVEDAYEKILGSS